MNAQRKYLQDEHGNKDESKKMDKYAMKFQSPVTRENPVLESGEYVP